MIVARSILYLVWFVVISVAMNVGALPCLALSRRFTVGASRVWAGLLLWGLKHIAGLGYELRGTIPAGGHVLMASKHYTMWETIAALALFNDPAIVLKRELLHIPLYGWYTAKLAMIPIDRAEGAGAIRAMRDAARSARDAGRSILIFPEGTRRKVGAPPAYKPGVAALYGQLGLPCVPVAHNSGLFWTQGGLIKKPGTIVVEFLEPIPAGLPRPDFMAMLEMRIETACNRLIAEARPPTPR